MKKLLLIAAVTIASVTAHASNARLSALQNAAHLSDFQDVVLAKPDQAVNYEAAIVEFGSATANQEAEGGFVRKMGDSAWGLYLGRSSSTYAAATSSASDLLGSNADEIAAANTAFKQDNTLHFTYAAKMGSISWGAGLFYVGNDFKNSTAYASNAENITGTKKQNIMGLLFSAGNGTWDAQIRQGLTASTDITIDSNTFAGLVGATSLKLDSTSSTKLRGGYLMDTMYFYGSYDMNAGEAKVSGTKAAETSSSVMTVGVVNSHKKDGVDFFYGASAVITASEVKTTATTKTDSTVVPLIVGVEAEATSWMTLRGALTQNLSLLSSTKTTGGKASSVVDSTTTSFGAGFKWGKATIDTVLGTGTSGTFGLDDDGNNFAKMSVTYNF